MTEEERIKEGFRKLKETVAAVPDLKGTISLDQYRKGQELRRIMIEWKLLKSIARAHQV